MRLYTPIDRGSAPCGDGQGKVTMIENAAILCNNGVIERVGEGRSVMSGIPRRGVVDRNMGGATVIPGFVDPHTHMCFASRREREFVMRLEGTPYLEILKSGGGILSSVSAVRAADEYALYRATLENAGRALLNGTTTVEIKSGYGLDLETELKMLRVSARVGRSSPIDVVTTFMGAHAVPEEYR